MVETFKKLVGRLSSLLTTKNIGLGLNLFVFLVLGLGGINKIVGTTEMVNNFTFMNLLPYIEFIGIIEVVSVILLLIPRTSLYGAVLVGSIMSAAVALHLSLMGGDNITGPLMLGSFAWVGYFLRNR
jgi:putative oxidoreductase